MRCSKCGSENPASKKFCEDCGTPLEGRCAKCGAVTTVGKRFCGECGAPLDATALITVQPQERRLTGERRHLTVLFCDLVGSTEIAARLDPEEWRETVAAYHRAAAEAITRYGGYVAKYLGDGVMAYFGWPAAHDDDAERAARAGLAILGAIEQLNERSGGTRPTLSARIGIDSGAVVVGAGAGEEADIFGDTPNVAARVQNAAEPNSVLITGATHRLVSGLFVVEERGAHELRGVARPIELYRVVRPSGMRGRLAAAAAVHGMTPFVDREEEFHLLLNRWERSREGEGQVVMIVGEAGIGKSRLLHHFRERIATDAHTWLECAAAALFQNTPFYAIVDMLQQTFHFHAMQNIEHRLAALEGSLASAAMNLNESLPLIASVLGLPPSAKYPPSTLPPEQQRRRLLTALVAWTIGFAKAQPLVIATEDLHWADPSTLELTQLLVEQSAAAPLMLLYTARPEFRMQWPLRSHHTQLTLNRLSPRHVRMMVGQVAAQKALSEEMVAAVVERTSGVPLFIEELTRTVLEGGSTRLGTREVPVTLHDSLMARLDRLGAAKEVLQIGAVIGSEFSYELLQAVHAVSEQDLRAALLSLTDAELLYVRGIVPEATYQFKHALIRDAAYEALLKSRRRELHSRVADTIEQRFPALKKAHPEILAQHWSEAGEIERAIEEWARSGKMAEERHAFHEAQASYEQALALLTRLPESPARDQRELQFRNALVLMLHVARGWAAPETADAVERVNRLAEKSGDLRELVGSMVGRCLLAYIGGDYATAGALADHTLALAQHEGTHTNLAYVHMLQICICFQRGDLAGSEKYFAAGLEFFDDFRFRQNPNGGAIVVFGTAAWNAWMLGRVEVARQRMAKAMAAVNAANPHDLPWAEFHAAGLHALIREDEQVAALAPRVLELCEKHGFPNEAAFGRVYVGIALARSGRANEGVELIRKGIDELLKVGNRASVTALLTDLAEAQARGGATVAALETIEQALQFNPQEGVYRPRTLRLRGELRLAGRRTELAEADFRASLGLARTMGAKAWELQTTVSLARLLDSDGRRGEAQAMLAEIYSWFTEGFDTADLKDAKVLLDKLSE
jgi:class 3 adenylate cyclase/ABC-type lipoprotein export system ATPase subunit